MKLYSIFFIGIVITTISLVIIQVLLANKLSTDGVILSSLQQQIHTYQQENLIIGEKLYTMSSYTQIASSASEMGFVQNVKRDEIVINKPLPIAFR